MDIMVNGKFIKVMFLLFSVFFGLLISIQLFRGEDRFMAELVTAMIVFFAFAGRSLTDGYRENVGLNDK